jgi:predicted PurR-regulated permease PerM
MRRLPRSPTALMTIILGEHRTDNTDLAASSSARASSKWSDVPWRTIIASVVVVAASLLIIVSILATLRVLLWILIAGFFAIVLAPGVRRVQGRVGGHRGIATAIVMFTATAIFFGMVALFVMPIRTQIVRVVTDLPGTIDAAANGNGPIGNLVTRLNLASLVSDNKPKLQTWADDVTGSSFTIARSAVEAILASITVFVTAFLLLTQSSAIGKSLLAVIPQRRQLAAKRVSADASAAVSGYMAGNLLISLIAGSTAFACLTILGVPNAAVFALWVAFADLIPLIGATLGAAAAVLASFLHSPTAGLVAVGFFIAYQQFENSVLQTNVMARTVKVNPLVVLLSVVLGVELFGFAGALFAIPLAGSVQVLIKEIVRESRRDHLVLPDLTNSFGSPT